MNNNPNNESELKRAFKGFAKAVDDTLDFLIERIGHRMTYEEYLDVTSDYIDNRILNESREHNLICYGGKAQIRLAVRYNKKDASKEFIVISVELYFKTPDGAWNRSTFNGSTALDKYNLDDSSTLEQVNKFRNGLVEVIDIEPPKANV